MKCTLLILLRRRQQLYLQYIRELSGSCSWAAEYQVPSRSAVRIERRGGTPHKQPPAPPTLDPCRVPVHLHEHCLSGWTARCRHPHRDFSFRDYLNSSIYSSCASHGIQPSADFFCFILYVLEIPITVPLQGRGWDILKYPCKLNPLLSMKETKDLRMSVGPNLRLLIRLAVCLSLCQGLGSYLLRICRIRQIELQLKKKKESVGWMEMVGQGSSPQAHLCSAETQVHLAPGHCPLHSLPLLPGNIPTGGTGGSLRSFSGWTLNSM